jgi:AhpC/TSA family
MSSPRFARAALGSALLVGAATVAVVAAGRPQPAQAPPASPPPAVKVGDAAPDFTLPYLVPKPDGGFETRQVALSSFKGKQNVVLAFFPAAFSPG